MPYRARSRAPLRAPRITFAAILAVSFASWPGAWAAGSRAEGRVAEDTAPQDGAATETPAARLARLAAEAEGAPDPAVRRAARRALGDLDREDAAAVLGSLARRLPAVEREHAVAALPVTRRSAGAVLALVRDGLGLSARADARPEAERTAEVAPEVLALGLLLHGRLLAEAPDDSAGRAALIVALAHPDPLVRGAAARGFDALLGRLAELADAPGAIRVLEALGDAGLDPRVVAFQSARFALFPGAEPARAGRAARALEAALRAASGGGAADRAAESDRIWLYRLAQLDACVALAEGRPEGALVATARGARALDALLAERRDRGTEGLRREHAEALVARALVATTALVAELARGADGADLAILEAARDIHALTLEAQVVAADVLGQALGGLDPMLDDELSPLRLVFHGRGFPALSNARALELVGKLGRALATVAPRELPGFEPFDVADPALADPLADPRRSALLAKVQEARVDGARRELGVLEERVARERVRGSLVLPEELLREAELADLRVRIAMRDLSEDEGGPKLLELRVPSALGLWYARDLAADGRPSDARIVAGRYRQDLDRHGISRHWFFLGHERVVRALMQLGAAFTDEGKAAEAEATLLEAVERIEDVERQLTEQGATPDDLDGFRQLRSSALVSLAVNANVRKGDMEAARRYFERAYELRQDEFMRALLACYRARAGRALEARELLRGVEAAPGTWYNLACARALLGDTQEALDLLERELADNHGSASSRSRQIEWARADPDLERLRGDPRFELLLSEEFWAKRDVGVKAR